ncbi:hypothetical protein F8M41_000205 [Gigaspora margarita]|uniref:Uncharacterized protein n=1 Tax=Gigaspora margarita TaxID=4874 RepID=A0A8H3XGD8_GIGMA|nr:hypothetical protein F8M41_000205 [Gigaspora margarita]
MERAEYGDVEGKFDPGGFCCQNGIVAERDERKTLERYPSPAEDKDPDTQDYLGNRSFAIIMLENTCKNWTQKVTTRWCGIMGELSNSKKEEFGPEQVLTFDVAAGRVVKESVKMESNRNKKKMESKKLAESRRMMNLTKDNFRYLLTCWSCSRIFDPGGMFLGKAPTKRMVSWNFDLKSGRNVSRRNVPGCTC